MFKAISTDNYRLPRHLLVEFSNLFRLAFWELEESAQNNSAAGA